MPLTRKSQSPNSMLRFRSPLTLRRSRSAKSQIPNKIQKKIVFIVGPTAVGKSETAVALAKRIKGEIISCDSMQVYKGMDIITSKPSPSLRKMVRHHLIGVKSPSKEYDVSQYRKEALKKIKEIIKRGKPPIFAGGTGLYMSILIDGIFDLKSKNNAIRKRFLRLAETRGSSFIYKKLQLVDPEASAKIHPHDAKRIVRALEVFEIAGKPISQLQKQRKGLSDEYKINIIGLDRKRDELYRLIDERVDKMFDRGLEQEACKLLKSKLSRTAGFAIGLREFKGYFDGLYNLEETRRLIKRNTRQYAKRQLTWFRKDKRIKWVKIDGKKNPLTVANEILGKIKDRRWSERY
ncbi:MAG: tRNA (adenosine(37)-N6)-dimethylallyltransferase MiaA [Candidatus Omnitrophota bacterium]